MRKPLCTTLRAIICHKFPIKLGGGGVGRTWVKCGEDLEVANLTSDRIKGNCLLHVEYYQTLKKEFLYLYISIVNRCQALYSNKTMQSQVKKKKNKIPKVMGGGQFDSWICCILIASWRGA